jgi:hypothetical protein
MKKYIIALLLIITLGGCSNGMLSQSFLQEGPVAIAEDIEYAEDGKPKKISRRIEKGEKKEVKNEKAATRVASWHGIGGPEAITKDQGIAADKDFLHAGEQKGQGIAESIYYTLRSWFWGLLYLIIFVGIVFIAWKILVAYIPSLSPANNALKKALNQTVKGVQSAMAYLSDKDKKTLKDELSKSQDDKTKELVNKEKK